MITAKPLKCAARDFTKDPFYLIQPNGNNKRFVASFRDKEKIKSFLLSFIDKSDNELQVKIRDYGDRENPVDFVGPVTKQKLKDTIEKYEELIFHDGYHELMMRLPKTGDYVAFDEHGLVFIYTHDNLSEILNAFNLTHKANEKLIDEFDHWHYRPAQGKEDLTQLINDLRLEKENYN